MLFPSKCWGCEKTGDGYLCSDCRAAHFELTVSSIQSATLCTLGPYTGLLRESVLAVKNKGLKVLAEELALFAAVSLSAQSQLLVDVNQIMAVPGSMEGTRFRGFSFPNILATSIAEQCRLDFPSERVRASFRRWAKSSKGATAGERLSRLQTPAPSAAVKSEGRGLLLVDDVVTTGATLGQAVEQARAMGYCKVICFAVADYREQSS